MSPRAAWRLETLGFGEVYDYAGGKSDWLAAGLPVEGHAAHDETAVRYVHDVPTCTRDETLGDVRARVQAAGEDVCVVVHGDGVVLGRVRGEAFDGDPQQRVEAVMEDGPTTVRANEPLGPLLGRMEHHGVTAILVTDADGRLLGELRRDV
jgi:Mg/Co/Ni transporter MgtE